MASWISSATLAAVLARKLFPEDGSAAEVAFKRAASAGHDGCGFVAESAVIVFFVGVVFE